MAQPRDDRQKELFRPALDQIIDMGHPLAGLAQNIDWDFLDRPLGGIHKPGAGHPPLPVRLMAGLLILKHMHSLSDEALCARWMENPYFQFFCGEAVFRRELRFDSSTLTRWRRRRFTTSALVRYDGLRMQLGILQDGLLERTHDSKLTDRAPRLPKKSRLLCAGGNPNSPFAE